MVTVVVVVVVVVVQQETSLRPDIKYGHVQSRANSASPLPPMLSASRDPNLSLPPATSVALDYTSGLVCRLPLSLLQPRPPVGLEVVSMLDKLGAAGGEVSDQSHLTQLVVGCDQDPQECPPTEQILQEVSVPTLVFLHRVTLYQVIGIDEVKESH